MKFSLFAVSFIVAASTGSHTSSADAFAVTTITTLGHSQSYYSHSTRSIRSLPGVVGAQWMSSSSNAETDVEALRAAAARAREEADRLAKVGSRYSIPQNKQTNYDILVAMEEQVYGKDAYNM